MKKATLTSPSILAVLAIAGSVCLSAFGAVERETYRSPYSVHYSHPVGELIRDLEGPRGQFREQSSLPHAEWFSERVRREYGAWGPPARHYPAPVGVHERPLEWRRERVIATALRFHGYTYQHHHIPDWDPPANWPWLKVANGHNAKGVDCSNFTSFVYNLGFGLHLNSAIATQAEQLEIPGPGPGRASRVEPIKLPADYDQQLALLKTGDLVYIKNKSDKISHVIIWVGAVGRAPNDVPLILDSHGEDVRDSNGVNIPNGIYLRPFTRTSWYHHSASHAHRVLR